MGNTLWIFVSVLTMSAADLNRALPDANQLNVAGAALAAEHRYAEAETQYQAALAACSSCPEQAFILNNLGALYYATKAYEKAEPLLLRALADWPKSSARSLELDFPLHNLAALCRVQDRLTEAAPLYERALAIREARVGAIHMTLMPLLVGLSMTQRELGDHQFAGSLVQRTLVIARMNQTVSTSFAATRFLELGQALDTIGEIGEAEAWLKRALDIRTVMFGAGSPLVAEVFGELGWRAELTGDLREAEKMFRAAEGIYRSSHTANFLIDTRLQLARNLVQQKKLSEAERLFRWLLTQTDPESPKGLMAATGLARLLSLRHRYAEAKVLLDRVLEIDEKAFGRSSVSAAYDLSNSADIEAMQKHFPIAGELLERSLSILRERLPANHLEIGKVLAILADVHTMQGHREQAACLYREALDILEPSWGKHSPQLVPILAAYLQVLRARQDYAAAAAVEAQHMKIRVMNTLHNSKGRP